MHKFNPQHIEVLISEERRREVNPEAFLRKVGLKEGDIFLDLGCGPGFFSIPGAEVVGFNGTVYAVDTQEEMLDELRKRKPPSNLITIRSEENSIPVEDGASDLALVAHVLHEAEKKDVFLKELRRVLRQGGRAVFIDWEKKHEDQGPPFEERLSREQAVGLVDGAGFSITDTTSLNPSHYLITAIKERSA